MLGIALQQTTTLPPNLPVTVEGALLGFLGLLLYVVLPKLLSALTKFVDSWVENRQQIRRVETGALEKQIEQNENLFEEVKRRDELLAKLSETNVETQRLSNEQRAQFSEERKVWQAEMQRMVELISTKDVAIDALGKENLKLRNRNQELEEENARLKERLKKYETGELKTPVPDEDPASKPSEPVEPPDVWQGDHPTDIAEP